MGSSDTNRTRILNSARARFGASGYQATTVRGIARDAATDPSMVMHYFVSKEGLFAAAVEVDLELPDLTTIPTPDHGATLVAHFVKRWEDESGEEVSMMLLRSIGDHRPAVNRIQAMFRQQLIPVIAAAISDPEEAPYRSGLALTHILGLAVCRYLLELSPLTTADTPNVTAHVGSAVQRSLHTPLSLLGRAGADTCDS